MNKVQEFVDKLSKHTRLIIIEDYEKFERDGYIGDACKWVN